MAVQALVSNAILNRDRQAAVYALRIDPLTAALCSLVAIRAIFVRMWRTERAYLALFD